MRSLLRRPIFSEISESSLSASTRVSSSLCSHTESGTCPRCFFHKFRQEEELRTNTILAQLFCRILVLSHCPSLAARWTSQVGTKKHRDAPRHGASNLHLRLLSNAQLRC